MDNWTHVQEVDYDRLPFKYTVCHEYGYFSKEFQKMQVSQEQQGEQNDQW